MSQVEGHRLGRAQRLTIGGPECVEIGGLGDAARAHKSRLGPIGVGRARWREQSDIRALRVDGLVIVLEDNIVDSAAFEVDRAADARRIDYHARVGRQGCADGLRRCRDGSAWRRSGGRRARRQGGRGAARLRFGRGRGVGLVGLQSAPGARADTKDRRRNIATPPSPGPTARSREKGSACPRTSCSRVSVLRRPVGRPAPATFRAAAPGGAEGTADIIDERGETTAQRLAPGHQHVIVIALRLKRPCGPQRLFQPPADPIALDRAADASGHCQSRRAPRGRLLSPLPRGGGIAA